MSDTRELRANPTAVTKTNGFGPSLLGSELAWDFDPQLTDPSSNPVQSYKVRTLSTSVTGVSETGVVTARSCWVYITNITGTSATGSISGKKVRFLSTNIVGISN